MHKIRIQATGFTLGGRVSSIKRADYLRSFSRLPEAVRVINREKATIKVWEHVQQVKNARAARSVAGCHAIHDDGWNLFKSKDIDVVLTDMMMPGLNGKELSTRIRKQSPFVKIGMMTGGETEVAAGLLKDGTVDYLFTKPFDIKNVVTVHKVATSDALQTTPF